MKSKHARISMYIPQDLSHIPTVGVTFISFVLYQHMATVSLPESSQALDILARYLVHDTSDPVALMH